MIRHPYPILPRRLRRAVSLLDAPRDYLDVLRPLACGQGLVRLEQRLTHQLIILALGVVVGLLDVLGGGYDFVIGLVG